MESTYWNNKGRYEELSKQLEALIPASGACPSTRPALERLRRANNAYYELFNNGNCNGNPGFKALFGVSAKRAQQLLLDLRRPAPYPLELQLIEVRVDALVLAAAIEFEAWERGEL